MGVLLQLLEEDASSSFDLLHVLVDNKSDNFWPSQLASTLSAVSIIKELYPDRDINLLPVTSYTMDLCNSGDSPYIFAISMMTVMHSGVEYDKIISGLINVNDGTDDRLVALSLQDLFGCSVEVEFPLFGKVKRDIYSKIPKELQAVASTCRRPEYVDGFYLPCEDCLKCREYAENGIAFNRVDGKAVQDLVKAYKVVEGLWEQ